MTSTTKNIVEKGSSRDVEENPVGLDEMPVKLQVTVAVKKGMGDSEEDIENLLNALEQNILRQTVCTGTPSTARVALIERDHK